MGELYNVLAVVSFVLTLVTAIVGGWVIIHKVTELLEDLETRIKQFEVSRAAREVLVSPLALFTIRETKFLARLLQYREDKAAIAQRISSYVKDNDIVIVDSGTTADQVPRELLAAGRKGVTVYTNNILAAMSIVGGDILCHLLPGILEDQYAAILGAETCQKAAIVPCQVAVVAATSISAANGPCAASAANRLFKLALLGRNWTAKIVFAVDWHKLRPPRGEEMPVFSEGIASSQDYSSWERLLEARGNDIVIVTTEPPEGVNEEERRAFEAEVTGFRSKNIQVDIVKRSEMGVFAVTD